MQQIVPTISLRPYQEESITRVLEAYHRQPKGGKALLVIPTGGGKTIVFCQLIQRLFFQSQSGFNVLIIAHRKELLQQAADKYRMLDPTAVIGVVRAGRHEYGAPITVASVDTISRPEQLKALQRFGYHLVIVDECHHSAADGYQRVLKSLPDAFVLGVTATPDRLDKQRIEHIFGNPIYSTTILDLVEQRYLCDVRAIAVHTTTLLDSLHTHDGDFKQEELEELIDTLERNQRIVQAYLEHSRGRQALCFAVTVEHARHLTEAFCEAGVAAAIVHGAMGQVERDRVLHDYERGTLTIICNVQVLTEGYDAPQTSCIIMARPTRSRALYVQMIGRGTRLAPGKQDCIVLDVTDNCLKHRLQPQVLACALEISVQDGESLTEARIRLRQEGEGRDPQERRITVSKRTQDLAINVLERLDWLRKGNGSYVLTVGPQKHQVQLQPSEEKEGYYSVWARLAPDFKPQQWRQESPLDWAQEFAERQVRLLLSGERKTVLVDRHAAWRCRPVTYKQIHMLRKFRIPLHPEMTSGEAADLLEQAIAEQEKVRTQKKAAQVKGRTARKRNAMEGAA